MSVWGTGDAEYFRAAIFRCRYTFRMARIETFSGRSGCQGTGLFFWFIPRFLHQLTVSSLSSDDSWVAFFYFYTTVFIFDGEQKTRVSPARIGRNMQCHACAWINDIWAHSPVSSFSCTVDSHLTRWIALPARQERGMTVREVTSFAFALNDLNG